MKTIDQQLKSYQDKDYPVGAHPDYRTVKQISELPQYRYHTFHWRWLFYESIGTQTPPIHVTSGEGGSVYSFHKNIWFHVYNVDIDKLNAEGCFNRNETN